MIARLYSNENFPLPVVEALRGKGHDVLSTGDAGKSNTGIPDEEVLRFAIAEGRAVLTHNRQDFIRLHRLHPGHEGIIVCTENAYFPALEPVMHFATPEASWKLAGGRASGASEHHRILGTTALRPGATVFKSKG